MPNSSTMSVYLGSGEEGIRNERLIAETAARHGMNKSEYALFCMLEQLKREAQDSKR